MDKEEIIIKLKFFHNPGIIINEEGIVDNSTIISKRLIRWTEIKDYSAVKTENKKFMLLFIDDPEHFLKEANRFAKFQMKWNMRKYKTPIRISTVFLQCSFDELKKAILEGMKNHALSKRDN
ncbi:MAG: STM3941 family protein [Ferruginibacter sp.]